MTMNIEQRTHAAVEKIEVSADKIKTYSTDLETRGEAALASIGGKFIGEYAANIQFTDRYDYVIQANQAYKVKLSTALPFTASGNFINDQQFLEVYDNGAEAKQAEVNAKQSEINAENSANAAAASAKIYKTVAEGIAATTNGQLFLVISDKESGFSDLYLNDNGAGVYQDKTTTDINVINEIRLESYDKAEKLIYGLPADVYAVSSKRTTGAWLATPSFLQDSILTKIKFKKALDTDNEFELQLAVYSKVSAGAEDTYLLKQTTSKIAVTAQNLTGDVYTINIPNLDIRKGEFVACASDKRAFPYETLSGESPLKLISISYPFKPTIVNPSSLLNGEFNIEYQGYTRRDEYLSASVKGLEISTANLEADNYLIAELGELDASFTANFDSGYTWFMSEAIQINLRIVRASFKLSHTGAAYLVVYRPNKTNTELTCVNRIPFRVMNTDITTYSCALSVEKGDLVGLYSPSSLAGNTDGSGILHGMRGTPDSGLISELTSIKNYTLGLSLEIETSIIDENSRNIHSVQQQVDTLATVVDYGLHLPSELSYGQSEWEVDLTQSTATGTRYWWLNKLTEGRGKLNNIKLALKKGDANRQVFLSILEKTHKAGDEFVGVIELQLDVNPDAEGIISVDVQHLNITFVKDCIFGINCTDRSMLYGADFRLLTMFTGGLGAVGKIGILSRSAYGFGMSFDVDIHDELPSTQVNRNRLIALETSTQNPILPFDYNMILGTGQSLMEGSRTSPTNPLQVPITTSQEYNTLCYLGGSSGVGGLQPATVDNSQFRNRGEWSGLGCAKILRELTYKAKNQSPELDTRPITVVNHGFSGAPLAALSKGSGHYESGIQCLQKLEVTSLEENKTSGVLAIIFMQGEADHAGDEAAMKVWRETLNKMANDYYADSSAINGQILKPKLFSYQLSTYKNMALNQLEASDEYTNIVLAAPIYHLGYYDTVHIHAAGERRMGGYFAKAIYQEQILGNTWQPLRCTDIRATANKIVLTFNRFGLVFDDKLLAKQTNFGFYVMNGSVVVNIDDVQVINSNQVRLITREPLGDDAVVGYGTPQTGLPYQIGFAGNLRDSSGTELQIDGYPLHDWCVMFEQEI